MTRLNDYNVEPKQLTAILVSHSHLNHCNDVNALISAITDGKEKRGILISNKTLVSGDSNYMPYITDFHKSLLDKQIILSAGQKHVLGEIDIIALRTKHADKNAIGFKFITPYFTLSYSSDTKYFKALADEYKNSNILVLNVPIRFSDDKSDNLSVDDAVRIITEVSPKLTIIQHFSRELLQHDIISVTRDIQKKTSSQVIAAKEGMSINPFSYSAEMGQKTLRAFSQDRFK